MSARKMSIYYYKIGNGILTYYRGGVHLKTKGEALGLLVRFRGLSPSFRRGFRALSDCSPWCGCVVAFGNRMGWCAFQA